MFSIEFLKFKKSKCWMILGNTLIIAGFTSFSNHPDWGIYCSVLGALITLTAFIKK